MIIGLTGGIASGKTTATSFFESHNIPIIDADLIAREITSKGHPVLEELANTFGSDILNNGELDRAKLRQRAFKDQASIKKLNSITHPAIRNLIIERLNNCNSQSYKILSAPLLFENRLEHLCDETWLIDIDSATQIKRIMSRDNCDNQTAVNIIKAQMSSEKKRLKADIIIKNDDSLENFLKTLHNIHNQTLLKQAQT